MITYPIPSNLCKKRCQQCYGLYNCPFSRSSHWRCSVRKGALANFAKFTGKHFWSFSCLLLKISCLFHSNKKMRWKKGSTLMELKHWLFCSSIDLFYVRKMEVPWWSSNIYFFARVSICLTSKISKETWQMAIWSENVFQENLYLQFSWLEKFR